jgi:protein phosphatase PTC7
MCQRVGGHVFSKSESKLLLTNLLFPFTMTLALWSSSVLRLLTQRSTCQLVSVSQRANRPITRTFSSTRPGSPPSRPYQFHFGASWAAKPPEKSRIHVPFSPDTTVGRWRDGMLGKWRYVTSRDAGEDFFFVTEVRPRRSSSHVLFSKNLCVVAWIFSHATDAK